MRVRVMFEMYKLKVLVKWPLIQAHLCTLAIAFSYNSTWFIPRDSFRYGALTYGLLLSVAMLLLALPVMLLQLAVGQLSQQDAVAVWRAIPFFKGVGYLRLLISFVVSLYSIIDMAMSGVLSFYTISNSIPFSECKHNVSNEDQEMEVIYNATTCFSKTFLGPVSEQPEYFVAVALVTAFLWILFPFVLYYPVKSMKRIFYVLGPTLLVLCIVIICNIGNKSGYNKFIVPTDWSHFLRPNIWHSAIAQAFLSTQIAGGYLISAGDAVYSKVDVVWYRYYFHSMIASDASMFGSGSLFLLESQLLAPLYLLSYWHFIRLSSLYRILLFLSW
ncbi:sodium-dependent noradrenaline transporter-like [Leptidea sinapis]|uniref:sodium-dependent noradrenaline transporter-like n=1 Tax=Leptidea sinapis TaxID=189913 RepID=UPI0021C31BA8|nr:sodium-dependent noradrenaline transporter-like [Leptidea sinapis]